MFKTIEINKIIIIFVGNGFQFRTLNLDMNFKPWSNTEIIDLNS